MRLIACALVVAAAACDASYDGTAFKCRESDACPDGQTCFAGRCRTAPASSIACGDMACSADEQCCADPINGNRCIPAIDECVGPGALCDGRDDCASGETCCNDSTLTRCFASCEGEAACAAPEDCPSDAPNCCPQAVMPWGRCQFLPCG